MPSVCRNEVCFSGTEESVHRFFIEERIIDNTHNWQPPEGQTIYDHFGNNIIDGDAYFYKNCYNINGYITTEWTPPIKYYEYVKEKYNMEYSYSCDYVDKLQHYYYEEYDY